MISITRSVARLVRATFRKVGDVEFREKPSVVLARTDASGLRLQARAGSVGAEFHLPGSLPAASMAVPMSALADFEGTDDSSVTLTSEPNGGIRAEWTDGGVPQRRTYAAVAEPKPWLEPPVEVDAANGRSFLTAINQAMSAAAEGSVKFALTHVLLRGSASEAVGTDGRQLLVLRGVPFPWKDDLLVARTHLLETKSFTNANAISMGRTEDHVVLRAGPWTAWLAINKTGRFPKYETIVPRDHGDGTHMIVSDEDAAFLATSLPRLPGKDDHESPITVHLNGAVVIRAKEDAGPLTELVLRGSKVAGKEVKIRTDRRYLRQAVQLGLRDFRYLNDHTPIVSENSSRLYVWMPLPAQHALGPANDSIRIESPGSSAEHTPIPQPQPQPQPRTNIAMSEKTNTHDDTDIETNDEVVLDPLQEADALRTQLRDTLSRVSRLVHALKRQRKQAQLVRSTLASLKQLQEVA